MRLTGVLGHYFTGALLLLLTITEAALSVKELQKGITPAAPIYNVLPGQLDNVLSALKDYNMIILITTSEPKYGCEMCGQLDPILMRIAKTIYDNEKSFRDSLFFIRVEAADNLATLKKLGVSSVPQIWGFPNSKIALGDTYEKVTALIKERDDAVTAGLEFQNPEWYDVEQAGMEHYVFELKQGDSWDVVIKKLADFISGTIKKDVREIMFASVGDDKKGIDWFVTVQWFAYVLVAIKIYQKIRSQSTEPDAISFWRDKKLYAYLSVVLILINLSGFNFTMQRQVPFISHKEGNILWVAPVSNTQFGSEIGISILLQISFAIALFGLISYHEFYNKEFRDIVISVCAVCLVGLLMMGAKIYHIKSPSYPLDYLSGL